MHAEGAILEFRLPDLGEGLADAELVSWSVAVGDHVDLNQIIAEVETAKAVVALPCPFTGTVAELLAEPGETVAVGSALIRVRDEDAGERVPAASVNGAGEAARPEAAETSATGGRDGASASVLVGYGPQEEFLSRRNDSARSGGAPPSDHADGAARVPAVPAARRLAKDLDLDLAGIEGTGQEGAVTVADVRAADVRAAADRASLVGQPGPESAETRIPVTGVRKRTAAAMVASATTIPQASTFLTLDCTASMAAVEHLRATPAFAELPLTPLTLVARAVLAGLAEYPAVNAHWDERAQQIVTKNYVNLGIAAATERGLLVPNVKQAQALSLRELCGALGRCVEAARSGTATPADLTGGTFTVTNVGVFGVDAGVPLVNPGEAAILCLGAIGSRPWVVDDALAVRQVTTLVLSFDHRLIDGALAARFLATVGALLTDPLTLLSR